MSGSGQNEVPGDPKISGRSLLTFSEYRHYPVKLLQPMKGRRSQIALAVPSSCFFPPKSALPENVA